MSATTDAAATCSFGRRPVTAPIVVALALTGCTAALGQQAAEHPTLVSVESAVCSTCHEDLIGDHEVVHAVVADDCTSCHDVVVGDSGTTVALMDQEPGLCLMCHDDLSAAAAGDLAVPHYPVTDSCLSCHDPHASDEPGLTVSAVPELCGGCHDLEELGPTHGGQLTEATDCVGCHMPHGSKNEKMLAGSTKHAPFADGSCNGCHRAPFGTRIRLRSRGEKLCEACHGSFEDGNPEDVVVHAALEGAGGKAGCVSCHDPHMSSRPKLLSQPDPQVCASCHEEIVKAAKAISGHEPAGEGCTNCHQPHVSSVPSLLQLPPRETCSMCHDDSDEDLIAAHLGADLTGLDCLGCHDPHGTGHRALLARNLHAPMLNGCDTCHEGAYDVLVSDGDSELCLICHDDIGEGAERATVPHDALQLARCIDCHNPHASEQPSLVKSRDGAICAGCHSDQVPGDGEVAHRVINAIGCEACHEPHGSENPKLLRVEGDELCLSCHDPGRIRASRDGSDVLVLDRFRLPSADVTAMASLRLSSDGQHGHPLANHRVLGQPSPDELKNVDTTFTKPMSCLTCHDPHKGRSRDILRWNASTPLDACTHCHPK